MDIRYAVGQRIMAGFPGTEIDEEFRALIHDYKIGNVILFRRNVESRAQLARLCGELKELIFSETGAQPFIAIDQEGGVVTRLSDDMINTPGGMALSAAGGDAPYRAGYITACELSRAGVNFNLAPVLDVNSNPDNPVIGVRSFGDDPEKVLENALMFLKGTLDGGVMACGKHFPGHGDTAVDSHLGLPAVGKARAELDSCELRPFRAAIKAGIPAIMTSHVLFPQLEPERLPATMSRRILTGLLRDELGFGGIIISDCMEMQAIAKYYGTVNGAAASIAAGADLVCISHTASLARETAIRLRSELEGGVIDGREFEAALCRIEAAKRRFASAGPAPGDVEADAAEAERLLENSFALVHGPLPKLGAKPFFTGCGPVRANLASSRVRETPAFAEYMASAIGGSSLVTSDDPDSGEIARVVSAAAGSSCIAVCTCNASLKTGQLALLRELGGLNIPLMVIALRGPYDLLHLPAGAAGIAAWEYTPRVLSALVPFIKGEREFTGSIPLVHTAF